MALTPEVRSSQGKVLVSYEGSPDLHALQAKTLVLYNLPAIQLRSQQAAVKVLFSGNMQVRASQGKVLVLYSGRVDSPKLKTWGFNLDSHTFYCIRLGSARKTLVFDLLTKQWSWWSREPSVSLDVHTGMNWRASGSIAQNYGSNVIAGDANNGNLYVLDPMYGEDQNSYSSYTFPRVATGQMIQRARNYEPVFTVDLTASLGAPALTANSVTLEYSDDQGHTYVTADEPQVTVSGDYAQEFSWMSLGLVRAPGRLFRITDDGAFARIDGLYINE